MYTSSMKNILRIIAISAVILVVAYTTANAQSTYRERIREFVARIALYQDNSIEVIETIRYDTGEANMRHGIYRDIRTVSSNGLPLEIENIRVLDENLQPVPMRLEKKTNTLRVVMGDPNVQFTGEAVYNLYYTAKNAVAHYRDHDELYWNVTGNDWTMPIDVAAVKIMKPDDSIVDTVWCYGDNSETKDSHCLSQSEDGYFELEGSVGIQDGFTIATSFEKGIFNEYTKKQKMQMWVNRYLEPLVALLMVLIALVWAFLKWRKHGKDAPMPSTIVTQYSVVDDLDPLEASVILHQNITNEAITAQLIQLAIGGYVVIEKLEQDGLIKYFTKSDYQIRKLRDLPESSRQHVKDLFENLFSHTDIVLVSSLKGTFQTITNTLAKNVSIELRKNGYYKNTEGIQTKNKGILVFLSFALLMIRVLGLSQLFYIAIAGVLIMGILIFLQYVLPAKTEKGMEAYAHLLGLKKYIAVAEQDRINFVNAPEKNPQTFEKFLPFAILFELEKQWVKEFEKMYHIQPTWYHGAYVSGGFGSSFSGFLSSANTSFSSSASSGGGYSGGGGGGGGGGSW